MKKILHLSMGGTISGCETDYPQIEKLAQFFPNSVDIGVYFTHSMKIPAEYSAKEVCKKDSRSVTDDDRKILLQEIERAYKEGVRDFLITHGTFTMPETGVFLLKNLKEDLLSEANIVITGAMYPMNLIGGDGLLNLGAAVSSLINTEKPLGVVINMHGKNWDPRKIKKDAENLIFEEE
jgi:L-asparaginase